MKKSIAHIGPIALKVAAVAWLLLLSSGMTGSVSAQTLDICGCAGHPDSLGDFVSSDDSTYPPGITSSGNQIVATLPDDGVLIFDSFTLSDSPIGGNAFMSFVQNSANTPVTILVAGNFVIGSSDAININGNSGESGNTAQSQARIARGGLGGPGGYKGGDGGYAFISGTGEGGAGLGPLGGSPGDLSAASVADGNRSDWLGADDLIPVTGASGGGGGSNTNASCANGGGAGGGGAILIAANGTVTISGTINARGASGGGRGTSNCSSSGGASAGGSIRIVANAIQGGGNLDARDGAFSGAHDGRIRMEAFSNSIASSRATPVASRLSAPGPVALFGSPTVAITAIAGTPLPQPPQGWRGSTDLLLPLPQTVTVEVETTGVAANTLVDVSVKPQNGGDGSVQSVPIDSGNCDPAGTCVAFADFDLEAGSYTFEAEATFMTPP